MGPSSSLLLCFAMFLVFTSSTQALDITKILGQFPEMSTMNDLLTKTKLAQQINSRNTLTILGLDNNAISSIADKPLDVVKKILAVHVLLDYYDVEKLTKHGLSGSDELFTTLFQASGQAQNNGQGFVKCDFVNEGETVFGSGVKGARLNAKLENQLVADPTDIVVLQITEPIIVPGIETASSTPSKPSGQAPVAAKPPTQEPRKAAAAQSPASSTKAGKSLPDTTEDAPFHEETAEAPSSELPEEESGADQSPPPASSAATSGIQAVGLGVAAIVISCIVAL